MTKAILIKLGKLRDVKEKLHNAWVDSGHKDEELYLKKTLVHKVFKCLEETSRGKIKSNIPYPKMADFLIENVEKLPYKELHAEVMKLVLLIQRK